MTVRATPKTLPLLMFVSIVALDQLTKTLVLRNIGLRERVASIGPLSFVRRYNTGVAFSLGNGSAITAWLVTVVVAALLVWVVRTISRGAQPLFAVLLAIIAGGGVGNQLDRLFRGGGWNKGAVVDFIDVGLFNFAIFNVADMALSVGCVTLAVWTLLSDGPLQRSSPDAEAVFPATFGEDLRSTASLSQTNRGSLDAAATDVQVVDCSSSNTDGAALAGQSSTSNNEPSTKGR